MNRFIILLLTLPIFATAEPTDPSTLTGKVMVGYQGWFNCEGDGTDLGWKHWARHGHQPFGPGNVTVDLWPDLSEFGPEETYATGFQLADGSPAQVFSSRDRPTVVKHFEWIRDYGIDGAFLQRFANGLQPGSLKDNKDAVLENVRSAAKNADRTFAVMYDLSGLKAGETSCVIEDWKQLRRERNITDDAHYLHHEGHPVVSVWGIGFSDDRAYTLAESRTLIEFLKTDGCTVMLGIPSFFREQTRDAIDATDYHEILALADILSPWTVGRYQTPEQAKAHGSEVWAPDIAWCEDRGLDFLPVCYPGFSWRNLKGAKIDAIPRRGGEFLFSQFRAAKQAGAKMLYVAMFDEVDEGTAIMKCTNDIPVGDDVEFLGYHGLPSDHYLKLTGQGGRLIRDELD